MLMSGYILSSLDVYVHTEGEFAEKILCDCFGFDFGPVQRTMGVPRCQRLRRRLEQARAVQHNSN